MTLEELRAGLDNFSDAELDQAAAIVRVKILRRSQAHRLELTRTLDDRDNRNWLDEDSVIDELGRAESADNRELLTFLASLGENDNLRGEFVEKDTKGRNIEVSVVGKHAIYFHIEPDSDTIRILRIVPTS